MRLVQLAFLTAAFPFVVGCAPVKSQAPALIEYQRSGGIAGRTDRLVIDSDGAARRTRGTAAAAPVAIPADTLTRLRALLQGIRFDTLRAEYLPPRPGADMYEYVIVYGGRRVRCVDTAIPPELAPLVDFLNRILRSPG